ncbi:hypothetical protein [Streptomyces griseus]|uniref:hypothetical protein n=1 Tax=Streptomyces griseus TaxID=1911 RepID=UPI000564DC9F|nr:hypothetical protein [Streptomyces griseus]
MRRTSRALSVAALVAAALVTAAPAVSADPDVEVSPSRASAGGDVTVSLSCDPLGGPAPETLEATSEAFDGGKLTLTHVPGDDDELSGPAYSGTGRIAPADGGEGAEDTGDGEEATDGAPVPDAAVGDSAGRVDGACPAPPGGQGQPWSATFDVSRGSTSGPAPDPVKPCTSSHGGGPTDDGCTTPTAKPCTSSYGGDSTHDCAPATVTPCTPSPHGRQASHDCAGAAAVQRGVRAGEGGSYEGSVPALVIGGLLIAGAVGAAVHRVRHRDPEGR